MGHSGCGFRRSGTPGNRPAAALVLLLLAAAAALPALASDNGFTGRTATTSGGCGSCHSTLSGTTTAVLSGPATLAPGATGSYTCVVTHSPAYSGTSRAGIDIAVKTAPNGNVDAGTLAASGSDLKKSGNELTHPSPKTLTGSPSTGSYAFTWTAPATAGTYTMQAIAIVTNGSKPGVWGWAAPLAVTVAAATPAPVAGFTFSPTSPVAGATVTFTDTSTGSPTSWSWSFGDGGTSTAQNPTHPFATAGVRQGSGFRTNLVRANLKETSATVSVTLLLADGTTATARTVDLGPWGFTQLGVETDLGVASLAGGSLLLATTTTDGQVAAYASVIDGTTGDPRSILAR